MRVTVLFGGPSEERDVSLISGKAVAEALRSAGHDVFTSDVSPSDLSALNRPCDVIFPALHGQFGESGELQQLMEERRIPFVGSSSHASRLGIDKVESKLAWEQEGLPTAPWHVALRGAAGAVRGPGRISAPCVVKPINSGSSIDVFICRTEPQVHEAVELVMAKHGQALVEKYISGIELTVAILEDRALPPIKIVTTRQFFDYNAKYVGNDARHEFELGLEPQIVENIKKIALHAHRVIECRDLSRVDMMLDADIQPFLLEINTMPGFTPRSLLPEAAARAGINFVALCDRLVRCALERGPTTEATSTAA